MTAIACAAELVHKAIKEIEGKHHHPAQPGTVPGAAATPPKAKEPAVHEPQGNSDAQLREALHILEATHKHLTSKHPKAAEKVASAIQELHTALGIK